MLRTVQSVSVLPEKGKGGALWSPYSSQQAKDQPVGVKEQTEGGLLSDIREVQCLICSLQHQMFSADPNIAKLVHFQVMCPVITNYKKVVAHKTLLEIFQIHCILHLFRQDLQIKNKRSEYLSR